jgi:hypothetical protein
VYFRSTALQLEYSFGCNRSEGPKNEDILFSSRVDEEGSFRKWAGYSGRIEKVRPCEVLSGVLRVTLKPLSKDKKRRIVERGMTRVHNGDGERARKMSESGKIENRREESWDADAVAERLTDLFDNVTLEELQSMFLNWIERSEWFIRHNGEGIQCLRRRFDIFDISLSLTTGSGFRMHIVFITQLDVFGIDIVRETTSDDERRFAQLLTSSLNGSDADSTYSTSRDA